MGRFRTFISRATLPILAGAGLALSVSAGELRGDGQQAFGLGSPATDAEIRAWDIDIPPSGAGLPAGRGTAKEGAKVYAAKCASCHGETGVEGRAPRLVGGIGTLATTEPIKTVGSYWPYATSVFDYVRRAMPFTAPQSLTPEETYAVVAWMLFKNGIITEETVMDAQTLPMVEMPNRDGFVPDPRPDMR